MSHARKNTPTGSRPPSGAAQRRATWQRRTAYVLVAALVLSLMGTGIFVLAQTWASPSTQGLDCSPAAGAGNGAANAPAEAPDAALAEGRTWTGTIHTNCGDIGVELYGSDAPQAVANLVALAQSGFFDDTACHRLTTAGIFVLQCGDPTATGTGGPAYRWGPVENAPADDIYPAGTIAMARVGNDAYSMGSQFFIVYSDSPIPSDAAGGYSVFGRVTSGLELVQVLASLGLAADGIAPAQAVVISGVSIQ